MTQLIRNRLKVKEGITELSTDSRTFIYPEYRGSYFELYDSIPKDGLVRPTMTDIVDLVHASFRGQEGGRANYEDIILEHMKNRIYAFTGNLYIPNKGVYIQDDPKTGYNGHYVHDERNKIIMDELDLVKKLESKDPSVRFVPFGFKTGLMTPEEIAKNHYIIALVGEEGAEKLAATNYGEGYFYLDIPNLEPYLEFPYDDSGPIVRCSALCRNYNYQEGRIVTSIRVCAMGDDSSAVSFGLLKRP